MEDIVATKAQHAAALVDYQHATRVRNNAEAAYVAALGATPQDHTVIQLRWNDLDAAKQDEDRYYAALNLVVAGMRTAPTPPAAAPAALPAAPVPPAPATAAPGIIHRMRRSVTAATTTTTARMGPNMKSILTAVAGVLVAAFLLLVWPIPQIAHYDTPLSSGNITRISDDPKIVTDGTQYTVNQVYTDPTDGKIYKVTSIDGNTVHRVLFTSITTDPTLPPRNTPEPVVTPAPQPTLNGQQDPAAALLDASSKGELIVSRESDDECGPENNDLGTDKNGNGIPHSGPDSDGDGKRGFYGCTSDMVGVEGNAFVIVHAYETNFYNPSTGKWYHAGGRWSTVKRNSDGQAIDNDGNVIAEPCTVILYPPLNKYPDPNVIDGSSDKFQLVWSDGSMPTTDEVMAWATDESLRRNAEQTLNYGCSPQDWKIWYGVPAPELAVN